MLELDRTKLAARLLAAHKAIANRMQAMAQDHCGTPDERNAISDALNGLVMLQRELDGKNKEQAAGE